MKAHRSAALTRHRLFAFIVMVLVLMPYTTSVGEGEAHFTLQNRTRLYVHVSINNKTYAYVAPGGTLDYEVSASGSLFVDVAYSPGQGVRGSAAKVVEAISHSSNTSTVANDCNNNNASTCVTSSTSEQSYTLTVEPPRWDVTAADLAPSDTLRGTP